MGKCDNLKKSTIMKKLIFNIAALFGGLTFLASCSPDDYTYKDNTIVDLSTITRLEIKPNQLMVLADGHAQLDLRPYLYTEEGHLVPDDRVKEEWLEYVSDEGVEINRRFSTTDASLVGKTLNVQAKLKGSSVTSDKVSFTVAAPLEAQYEKEIVIPVVMHIIQTTEEVEELYSKFDEDRLHQIVERMNNIFSGSVSHNPVGVNTHIRFQLAEYNPYGKRMIEKGINRLVVKEIDGNNKFEDFLIAQHLVWPASKYMNIWLMSDRKKNVPNFGFELSENCVPHFVNEGVAEEEILEGLELTKDADLENLLPIQAGIIYKLQELDEWNRSFGLDVTNDLIYYVGRFLGLSSTCSYVEETGDYCDDTIDYKETDESANNTWYKTMSGCYFLSENIMDDPTGVHNSVSKDQCKRMRWVLENCPERSFWKSDFAFKGR